MDNQQLKEKFEEINNRLEVAKQNGQEVRTLLKEKYELLKIGFEKIKEKTEDKEFDKNPKKYSTLLSYLNTMKETANEAGLPLIEVLTLQKDVEDEMKKNDLDWLLNK